MTTWWSTYPLSTSSTRYVALKKTVHTLSVAQVHLLTFQRCILEVRLCTTCQFLLLILVNVGEVMAVQAAMNSVLVITKKGVLPMSVLLCEVAVLKKLFTEKGQQCFSDTYLEQAAKATLLSTFEVKIWLDHLKAVLDNRRRGAEKAAATRRAKKCSSSTSSKALSQSSDSSQSKRLPNKEEQDYYCGQCRELYVEETDEFEMWVACDMCDSWYHEQVQWLVIVGWRRFIQGCSSSPVQ